jgi:hypothetical protein
VLAALAGSWENLPLSGLVLTSVLRIVGWLGLSKLQGNQVDMLQTWLSGVSVYMGLTIYCQPGGTGLPLQLCWDLGRFPCLNFLPTSQAWL